MNLLDADTVLAGHGTADSNRKLQNFESELFGAQHRLWIVAVEHDQRMKITVAGMKDIRASQTVLCLHRNDRFQYFADTLARNGSIHAVVRWRASDHRR